MQTAIQTRGDENGNDVSGSDHVKDGAAIGDYLISDDDDTITVKLSVLRDGIEYASMESFVPITWNTGEIKWEKASYHDNGVANVRLVDPDMNWNPDESNNFIIDAWSDSDPAGINLMMTETGNSTGIFEGTVFLDTRESSGHRLHVIEGDTITAEYEDNTLPSPYSPEDELDISDTAIIRNTGVPSPYKQMKNGIMVEHVTCNGTLEKIYKSDGSPACVKPSSVEKLIQRGWTNKISELTKTDSNNTQRLIELLESNQVSEFNNLKETMDLSLTQVSPEGADLHRMDLRQINLERVHIEHANLKDANLQGIVLDYRNIQYADLQGANLSNADISDVYLYGVNLHGADLTGASLKNTHVNDSDMDHANLQYTDLRGVNFQGASLIGTNFQGALLQGALMAETNLGKLNFDGANMQFANLEYADLHDASLQNTNMQNANLENANLRGANLPGAYLQGANLNNADLLGTNLSNVQNLPISAEEARQRGAITG